MFEKLKKKLEHDDKYANLTGITLLEAAEGRSKVFMPLSPAIMNSVGVVHGGALFTLADMAFSAAANAGQDKVMVSTNASISFMKGAIQGPFTALGRMLSGGKHLATVQVDIFDGADRMVVSAQFSGFRLDKPLFEDESV